MSKNVKLNDKNYTGVSTVQIPTTDGGTAEFKDVDEITVPTGTKAITANGTHDVSAYAQAVVNVPTGDGDTSGGGTSGVTEEVYSMTITEAANTVSIPYDAAWDKYKMLFVTFDGVTLSASDFLRLGYDTVAFNQAGLYPGGTNKATVFNVECLLLLRRDTTYYRVNDGNDNKVIQLPSLYIFYIFATTSTTNITGGTIKITGVQ